MEEVVEQLLFERSGYFFALTPAKLKGNNGAITSNTLVQINPIARLNKRRNLRCALKTRQRTSQLGQPVYWTIAFAAQPSTSTR